MLAYQTEYTCMDSLIVQLGYEHMYGYTANNIINLNADSLQH